MKENLKKMNWSFDFMKENLKKWMDFDMNWKGLKRLKVGDWNKCDRYMVIYDKDWKE